MTARALSRWVLWNKNFCTVLLHRTIAGLACTHRNSISFFNTRRVRMALTRVWLRLWFRRCFQLLPEAELWLLVAFSQQEHTTTTYELVEPVLRAQEVQIIECWRHIALMNQSYWHVVQPSY